MPLATTPSTVISKNRGTARSGPDGRRAATHQLRHRSWN
jgi:hypothetical protein